MSATFSYAFRFSLVIPYRMNRIHVSSSPINRRAPQSLDVEEEPEVWKYLGKNVKSSEEKKKKRLENARKFLKNAQSKRGVIKMSKNTFTVTDRIEAVSLDRIELPPAPPLPLEAHPPPAPPPLQFASAETVCEAAGQLTLQTAVTESLTTQCNLLQTSPSVLQYVQRQASSVSLTSSQREGKPEDRLRSARHWDDIFFASDQFDKRSLQVRLLSYNVLAQNLLDSNPQLYRNCEQRHLLWENRWKGIQSEVLELQPGIVCLQEVQFRKPNFFKKHYLPFFEALGYRAVFKCRTGDKQDGCAIFYKILQFKLEEYTLVEYFRRNVPLLDRDNIGIICRFQPRGSEDLPPLVVGTTHLLFNKKRIDIRLAQISLFLAELDRLSFSKGKYSPTIITGDFNSTVSSEVYRLVSEGKVSYEGVPAGRRTMARQLVPVEAGLTDTCQWERVLNSRQEKPVYGSGSFSHRFQFSSAYEEHERLLTDDRVVTTNHGDWVMVDFIFYNRHSCGGSLQMTSRLLPPRYMDMEKIGRIPSDICPSDHFPLVADFLLIGGL